MSTKLKKKYNGKFLSCFKYLKYAGSIISGDFYKKRVEQMTQEISEVVNNFITQGAALLKNVIDETEGNLYSIAKEDRETYVTGILKDFAGIAPYLNYNTDKKYDKEYGKKVVKIGDKTFSGCIDECHKLIIRYELKYTKHIDDLVTSEKYIILCFHAYRDFFNQLDAKCLNLNMDLVEIQQRNKILIWERDFSFLEKSGSTAKSYSEFRSKEHQGKNQNHQREKSQKPKLTIDKIALLHVYQGTQITRENGNQIAKEYGHNSGEKLFQRYTYYSSTANRKGRPTPCTPKKLQNKINRIESVIQMLPEDKRSRAEDEVSILHSYYNSEFL